jgi:hypothetical protein
MASERSIDHFSGAARDWEGKLVVSAGQYELPPIDSDLSP